MNNPYEKLNLYALDVLYLQTSLSICLSHEGLMAKTFYENLFLVDPSFKKMFGSDVAKQHAMFTMLIEAAAAEMKKPTSLEALLVSVGERHRKHHVTAEHLELGRGPFFKAIVAGIGEDDFNNHKEIWNKLYSLITGFMAGN